MAFALASCEAGAATPTPTATLTPTATATPTVTPTPTAAPTPTIEWLNVSGEDLAKAFLNNPADAAQRYNGKDLQVSGPVSSVLQPFPNAAWVLLQGTGDLSVGCYAGAFDREFRPTGVRVTLVGTGKGLGEVSVIQDINDGTPTFASYKYVELTRCAAISEGEPLPLGRPDPLPTP
jgi:hypothetical protein